MPEILALALSEPGLPFIAVAAFVAGLVRGFSGFGTAMIFLPIATQYLGPVAALVALVVMDLFGPLPNLPRAWRDGQPADIARLLVGLAVTLPIGIWLLTGLDREMFRLLVAVVSLALVACLVFGLRYRGKLRPPMVYAIGSMSGLLGGSAGLPGPPVILFYMASPLPAAAVRANTMMFLFAFDLLFLAALSFGDNLTAGRIVTGLLLAVPIVLGNLAGAAIFRPEAERIYRAAAYVIITASAVSALPVWG